MHVPQPPGTGALAEVVTFWVGNANFTLRRRSDSANASRAAFRPTLGAKTARQRAVLEESFRPGLELPTFFGIDGVANGDVGAP